MITAKFEVVKVEHGTIEDRSRMWSKDGEYNKNSDQPLYHSTLQLVGPHPEAEQPEALSSGQITMMSLEQPMIGEEYELTLALVMDNPPKMAPDCVFEHHPHGNEKEDNEN